MKRSFSCFEKPDVSTYVPLEFSFFKECCDAQEGALDGIQDDKQDDAQDEKLAERKKRARETAKKSREKRKIKMDDLEKNFESSCDEIKTLQQQLASTQLQLQITKAQLYAAHSIMQRERQERDYLQLAFICNDVSNLMEGLVTEALNSGSFAKEAISQIEKIHEAKTCLLSLFKPVNNSHPEDPVFTPRNGGI